MFNEMPPPRDAQALATIFDLARSFTGSFHPEDRAEWLEWIDAVQHAKQQRADLALDLKRDREEAQKKLLQERVAAKEARLQAKAALQVKKYKERTKRYVERQEAKAKKETERREAKLQEKAARQAAELLEPKPLALQVVDAADKDDFARVEAAITSFRQSHRMRVPGPRCQLCKEPGHSRWECRFDLENAGHALHDPYPHDPLWKVALEARGSLKP